MPTENKLSKRHEYYDKFLSRWEFYQAAYAGIWELLDSDSDFDTDLLSVFEQNERESTTNYNQRRKEAYDFGYSKSIVNIYNFYLFEKEPQRELGQLAADELFERFLDDCDLYGTNYNTWIINRSKESSIFGTVGILVDSPSLEVFSRQEQINQSVYPFLSVYTPQNILFWRYDTDPLSYRPFLSELLLYDGENYRYWTTEIWEVWGDKEVDGKSSLELINNGVNPIREIPFFWLVNGETQYRNIGVSDIVTVSRIDLSIINNLSQAEEVVKYAAFPMQRKPKPLAKYKSEQEDIVGPTAILWFDPDNPASKPDWLESPTESTIRAILAWLERKEQAIYQTANIGGLAATQVSQSDKSGEARKWEFRMLNSMLAMKAEQIEEAEYKILYFWLKWQGQENLYADIKIDYPRDFNIEQLEADLMNMMTAKQMVRSETFKQEIEKRTAKQVLPKLVQDTQLKIDGEIETVTSKPPATDII